MVHVDCDLYSSSLYVLCSLDAKLQKGDIVIFDEYSSQLNEFLAWDEYQRAFLRKSACIAMALDWTHVAFRIE